jgi:small-conductance mechanosensitive channel
MLLPMTVEDIGRAAIQSAAWIVGSALVASLMGFVLRKMAQRTEGESVLVALRLPVVLAVLVGGLHHALGAWPWEQAVQAYIERLAPAVLTVLGVIALVRVLRAMLDWSARKWSPEQAAAVLPLLRRVVVGAVWAVGLVIVLDHLGYRVGPLLASLGVAGVAVAIGLQDTVSGLFAGLYILLDMPFSVGEYIRLEASQEGFVQRIGWRSTLLKTVDGRRVIVPNVTLAKSITVVLSAPSPAHGVSVSGKAELGTDLAQLERACLAAAAAVGGDAAATFTLLGLSGGVEFRVSVAAEEEVAAVEHSLRGEVYRQLSGAGIRLV